MLIGCYDVGLHAERTAPRPSSGTVHFLRLCLDSLRPFFLTVGPEHLEISHGTLVTNP